MGARRGVRGGTAEGEGRELGGRGGVGSGGRGRRREDGYNYCVVSLMFLRLAGSGIIVQHYFMVKGNKYRHEKREKKIKRKKAEVEETLMKIQKKRKIRSTKNCT